MAHDAHEEQRSRMNLFPRHAGHLHRQEKMGLHVAARLVKFELGQPRVVRPETREKNMISPIRQLVEEALQLSEVGSVKGRAALCAKLTRRALKGLRIAGDEDEVRSPIRGQSIEIAPS
jgi:hypothetical protein